MKKLIITLALSLFTLNANATAYFRILTCTNNDGVIRILSDSQALEAEKVNGVLKSIYLVQYKNVEAAFDGTVTIVDDEPVSGLVNEPDNNRPLTITLKKEEDKITAHLFSRVIDSTFACEIK